MKPIFKFYFIISFIILLLLLGSIWFFSQESDNDKLQELRRFTVANFEQEFNRERDDLFKFSLALAEKNELKESLLNDNQLEAYELLHEMSNQYINDVGIEKLRLQLITNDLEIFAQNWKSDDIEGKDLNRIRLDLVELKKNPKAKVGIETGRRLTFKATIPIEVDEKNIGYLEVIQFIDEFVKKLRAKGIELFVLMDKKYIMSESLMKKFPRLKNYVIANENYDNGLKQKAESFLWTELENSGYFEDRGRLFILKDMFNGEQKIIGKYLMILRKEMFIAYKDAYQDTSIITRFSDKDIYNYVKKNEKVVASYRNIEDKEVVDLLSLVEGEDKAFVKEYVTGVLREYSKEELIDIVLENSHKEPKRGVIE